jgi:NTE family protein
LPKKTPVRRTASDRPEALPAVRVGLAFGGGLPFGLVALGVLRAFDEQRIPIHRMAGTSMGSIIAAMYAAGISYDESIDRFRQAFRRKHLLPALLRDVSFSGTGVLKGAEIVQMLSSFIGDRTFKDLRIPLRIPACDLADAHQFVRTGMIAPDRLRALVQAVPVSAYSRYPRLSRDGVLAAVEAFLAQSQ